MPKHRPTSNRSPQVLIPTLNSNTNYIAHTHTHTLQRCWLTTNQDPPRPCLALVSRGAAIVLVVDLRVRRELYDIWWVSGANRHPMEHRSTHDVVDGSPVSAEAGPYTLRRPDTTIPIHGKTMSFHRSSRGTDNFEETMTALVSTTSRAVTIHRNTTWLWVATLIPRSSSSGRLLWWATHMSQRSGIGRLLWRVTSMSQRSSKDQALWWAILTSQMSGEEQRNWWAVAIPHRSSKDQVLWWAIIIIIIINEEIIVAFSPKKIKGHVTKSKNKIAKYVVSINMEEQLVTGTTAQTIVSWAAA